MIKDALKILLLVGVVTSSEDHLQQSSDLSRQRAFPDSTIRACIIPLVERILQNLLPRLQALLLQRRNTDWAVVVSAMTSLSMTSLSMTTAGRYVRISPPFPDKFTNFENGWDILLGLYTAGYGGYNPLQANPTRMTWIVRADKTSRELMHHLKAIEGPECIHLNLDPSDLINAYS